MKETEPAFPGLGYIGGYGNKQPVSLPHGGFDWQELNQGMTLEDYFAGKALAGMCSNLIYSTTNPDKLADRCYKLAQAMCRRREKP